MNGAGLEVAHEVVQAALMLGAAQRGQMRLERLGKPRKEFRRSRKPRRGERAGASESIDRGGHGTAMAEVDLELPQVLALLQQMGGVGMAQGVDVRGLLDATGAQGQAKGALERGALHRLGGRGRALTAVAFAGKEQAGMLMGFPELAQQVQRALRQGHVTVAIALAGAEVQQHAPRIDIAHLQLEPFTQPQAAGVDRGQGDALIQGGDAGQNVAHFGGGEDDGQFELRGGAGELNLGGPAALEGDLPEVFDGADGLGGGLAGEVALGLEVNEVLAEILGTELIGGTVEVLAQLADTGPITLLGAGLEGQQRQVVGEAD